MEVDRTLYKILKAYYEKGLTQQEIANRYGISRIKVSRMLAKALKEKVVQIKIVPPEDPFTGWEHDLEEKYGFDEVLIVDKGHGSDSEWIQRAGEVAANYLVENLQGTETIGLTWGRTLHSVVDHIPPVNFPNLKIVQMLGGLGEPGAEFHGAELTRRMAQALGCKPRLIHSPGIVSNKEICLELKNDLQVKDTLNLAIEADIVLVGIGRFNDKAYLNQNSRVLSVDDKEELKAKGATGDISLRFFNALGQYISTGIDDRVVGLTAAEITKIPRIIGIAGGEEKSDVLKAVAKGKLVNVLILDNLNAEKLLQITND